MKVLVTGASGFIGSFLVEKGVEKGYEVWAGMRASSSRRFLPKDGVHFVELDMSSPGKLAETLAAFKKEHGAWDYVVHAAGVTKCTDKKEFFKVNYEGTKNLVDALAAQGMAPSKFIYLSSLSVFGPVREEQPYTAINDSDEPRPNTAYGQSKLMSEAYIRNNVSLPYVIFRPTGVYGPRERDYFKMAQSIKSHIDFAAGYKPQVITFEGHICSHRKGCAKKMLFCERATWLQQPEFQRLYTKIYGYRTCNTHKSPIMGVESNIVGIGIYIGPDR